MHPGALLVALPSPIHSYRCPFPSCDFPSTRGAPFTRFLQYRCTKVVISAFITLKILWSGLLPVLGVCWASQTCGFRVSIDLLKDVTVTCCFFSLAAVVTHLYLKQCDLPHDFCLWISLVMWIFPSVGFTSECSTAETSGLQAYFSAIFNLPLTPSWVSVIPDILGQFLSLCLLLFTQSILLFYFTLLLWVFQKMVSGCP